MFVPVVDQDNKPLMPTKPSRARRWIKEGKATSFWRRTRFLPCLKPEVSGA
ncbi:RRXRR domain-containing protein [Nitrosococcus halophilus]|uniref:RRXRR domain-containing protein n=1 Tax=Nitrosococcus halophilus TaxID=133539 RepID=UPI000A04AF9C